MSLKAWNFISTTQRQTNMTCESFAFKFMFEYSMFWHVTVDLNVHVRVAALQRKRLYLVICLVSQYRRVIVSMVVSVEKRWARTTWIYRTSTTTRSGTCGRTSWRSLPWPWDSWPSATYSSEESRNTNELRDIEVTECQSWRTIMQTSCTAIEVFCLAAK